MAELMALEQCLDYLKQDNFLNVVIEADSELVFNSVKRISCGIDPEKVSNHWRLIQVFQRIQGHLQELRTIRFNHVCRKANKLADILANQGVNCKEHTVSLGWQEVPQGSLKILCHTQVEEDREVYRNKIIEARLL